MINAEGVASERLLALGPITRGQFWEIVAVPDIRLHCVRLATYLTATLRERPLSLAHRERGRPRPSPGAMRPPHQPGSPRTGTVRR